MREYKVTRLQQQGIAVPNLDRIKSAKSFIPDKYNNWMELNKTKMVKYFTKALMELRDQGFSEEQVIRCANITYAVENLIMRYKALPTYREGDTVCIEFNTGHHDMVGKWEVGDIRVQGGVTNGVTKVK